MLTSPTLIETNRARASVRDGYQHRFERLLPGEFELGDEQQRRVPGRRRRRGSYDFVHRAGVGSMRFDRDGLGDGPVLMRGPVAAVLFFVATAASAQLAVLPNAPASIGGGYKATLSYPPGTAVASTDALLLATVRTTSSL